MSLRKPNAPKSKTNRRRHSLWLESLERRDLMAAVVTWNDGVVYLQGSAGDDSIVIRDAGSEILFEGANVRALPKSYVRRLEIYGNVGNDRIYNDTNLPALIRGGIGNDTITGGHGNDEIYGDDGNDFIRGRGGNDQLFGGAGDDTLFSDLDDKFEPGRAGSDVLDGGKGNDRLDGSIDLDAIAWNDGVLYLRGTQRTDRGDRIVIRQNNGQVTVDGLQRSWSAPSTIEVRAGLGIDYVYNDTAIPTVIYGEGGRDVLTGGESADVFYTDTDELVRGRGGYDTLHVIGNGARNRIIFQPLGSSVQVESDGVFWIAEGVERLAADGREGNDYLYNDTNLPSKLTGGPGDDSLTGGGGDDEINTDYDTVVRGRGGKDTVNVLCDAGDNRIIFRAHSRGVEVEAYGRLRVVEGFEVLAVAGQAGNDFIYNDTSLVMVAEGGVGNDTITGGHAADRIFGESGNDYLRGRGGDDQLFGGEGDDSLFSDLEDGFDLSRSGYDHLEGGQGNDRLDTSIDLDLITFDAGKLILRGTDRTDRGDSIVVRQNDGRLYVDGVRRSWNLPSGLSLDGGAGDDYLYNDTSLAMLANGDAGNDTIVGGFSSDVLNGGAGHDQILGRDGNDTIFGGDGNDVLLGSGNDSLNGGDNADRLLSRPGDSVTKSGQDAEIVFQNDNIAWTDAEILRIDAAFAELQKRTNNTKLLKRYDGESLTFERVDRLGENVLADNGDGWIRITSLVLSRNDLNATVFHEIGHNWDEARESGQFATTFRAQSQWKKYNGGLIISSATNPQTLSVDGQWTYAVNSTFLPIWVNAPSGGVAEYGRWNPYEDFATYFENAMTRQFSTSDLKANVINNLLNFLTSVTIRT